MNARLFVLPLLAIGVAVAAWSMSKSSSVPAATWRVGGETEFEQAKNWGEYDAESPLRVSWHDSAPRHVYVLSHSLTDGTLLMWPSAELRSDLPAPLPAGDHVLPGHRDGRSLAWTTRSQVLPATTYVLLAAEAPIPELDALLPKLRRWTTSVLADGSIQVTKPPADAPLAGAPGEGWPVPLLQQVVDAFRGETMVNGPLRPVAGRQGLWASVWSAKEKPGSAKTGEPGMPQLPDALQKLQDAVPPPEKR